MVVVVTVVLAAAAAAALVLSVTISDNNINLRSKAQRQETARHTDTGTDADTHTHKQRLTRRDRERERDRFNGHFPGKSGLSGFPLGSQTPLTHIVSILTRPAKSLHIRSDTIPSGLPRPLPPSSSINLHYHTETHCQVMLLSSCLTS